jgi:hypothetical protein
LYRFDEWEEPIGLDCRVRVEFNQNFASCNSKALIDSRGKAKIFFITQQTNISKMSCHPISRSIKRGIIDDNQFNMRIILCSQRW